MAFQKCGKEKMYVKNDLDSRIMCIIYAVCGHSGIEGCRV